MISTSLVPLLKNDEKCLQSSSISSKDFSLEASDECSDINKQISSDHLCVSNYNKIRKTKISVHARARERFTSEKCKFFEG